MYIDMNVYRLKAKSKQDIFNEMMYFYGENYVLIEFNGWFNNLEATHIKNEKNIIKKKRLHEI